MKNHMKITKVTKPQRRSELALALTAAMSLGLSAPLWAATVASHVAK